MLSKEVVRKIRKIELAASAIVNSELSGHYQAIFKGRGMSFTEVREYSAGDDVRSIDWNVSARMNTTHVKLFSEERDRTLMLLVDMSASSLFGTQKQSKREIAAEVAAMIALSAIRNNDRVGLIVFTDQVELYVPAKSGRKHVLRLIREILQFSPTGQKTDIGVGLAFLDKVIGRRTVCFLLSDFLDKRWQASVQIAVRRHDFVAVVLSDPFEVTIPNVGLIVFRDLETGEVVEFDSGGHEATRCNERAVEVAKQRISHFRRMRADYLLINTDTSHVDALVQFFRDRQRRMRAQHKLVSRHG